MSFEDRVELDEQVGFRVEVRDSETVPPDDTQPIEEIIDEEPPFDGMDVKYEFSEQQDDPIVEEPAQQEGVVDPVQEPVPEQQTEETPKKKRKTKVVVESEGLQNDLICPDDPQEEFNPNSFTNKQFNRFMNALNVLKTIGTELSIKNGVTRINSGQARAIVYCNMHLPNASFDLPDITSNTKFLTLFKGSDVVHFAEENNIYVFYSGKNSIRIRKALVDSNETRTEGSMKSVPTPEKILAMINSLISGESPHIEIASCEFDDSMRAEAMNFITSSNEATVSVVSDKNDKTMMFRCGDINRGQLNFTEFSMKNANLVREHISSKGGKSSLVPLIECVLDTTFMKWNYTKLRIGFYYNTQKVANDLLIPITGRINDEIDMLMLSRSVMNVSEE